MAAASPSKPVPISPEPSNIFAVVQQPLLPVVVARLPDHFTESPMDLICNVCHQHIRTKTEQSCNPVCFIIWGVCAMCMCQDVEHKCPNCNTVLGKYNASSC